MSKLKKSLLSTGWGIMGAAILSIFVTPTYLITLSIAFVGVVLMVIANWAD